MPLLDLPLNELEGYAPSLDAPDDLVPFWIRTLARARSHDLDLTVERYPSKLAVIETFDLTFSGFDGARVQAWLHLPTGATGPLPAVVQYQGYSGGRGFPHEHTIWAQAGYAHLVMDTRGQGWTAGGPSATADRSPSAGLNHVPGFMTAGLLDPHDYYYRRVFTDAVRLVETAISLSEIDSDRIIVTGESQGGGITLAVGALAALSGIQLAAIAPDVPFLCHFRRAIELGSRQPYAELTQYLAAWRDHAETAYSTLSYFDGAVLGRLATAPALFSVALMDPVCPPSTVFAAYNNYGAGSSTVVAPKEIRIYPHNGHEGGGPYQVNAKLDWFDRRTQAHTDVQTSS